MCYTYLLLFSMFPLSKSFLITHILFNGFDCFLVVFILEAKYFFLATIFYQYQQFDCKYKINYCGCTFIPIKYGWWWVVARFVMNFLHSMYQDAYFWLVLMLRYRSSHRDSFQKYMFFFSRSNLYIIFQEGPFVPQTDTHFTGSPI